MRHRPRRPFEVVRAKLPPRPRRSNPGGRWRPGRDDPEGPDGRKPEPARCYIAASSAIADQSLADWDWAENPDGPE